MISPICSELQSFWKKEKNMEISPFFRLCWILLLQLSYIRQVTHGLNKQSSVLFFFDYSVKTYFSFIILIWSWNVLSAVLAATPVKNLLYNPVFNNLGLWTPQLFCVYLYGHFSILPFKKKSCCVYKNHCTILLIFSRIIIAS